jgi:hypothetical protein
MKRTPEQLPDPWLFDSEALLKQLDRCRELVLRIPITDTQDIHFGINIAVDAIWNLQEQLRFLLRLHRDGQRQIARAHAQQSSTPATARRDNKIVSLAAEQRASVSRKTVDSGAPISRGRTGRPRKTSSAA